eukprot:GEZU01011109.1.p1 GENE.GEZU01011109.1~~GEZU01011109.1.p1  ORF type:complete len:362 (+),score=121.34 GEZU01011109.1:105-1190(+)
MAKVGEEDPRWIVSDMGDAGKNVNKWHWEEKGMMDFAKTRLKELFSNVSLGDSNEVKITGLKSVTGDCYLNNRKGKLFAFYELDITVDWKGEIKDNEGNKQVSAKGTIKMPYVSDENDIDDFEIKISMNDEDTKANTPGHRRLKDIVREHGTKAARERVVQFLKELKAGGPYSEASQKAAANPATTTATATATAPTTTPAPTKEAAAAPAKPTKANTQTITIDSKFLASPNEIYECLLDERRVSAFTQSSAKIDKQVGGKFELLNGTVAGEILELEPGQKIVQKWRHNDWPDDHYSTVTLDLSEEEHGGNTKLTLTQTDVPKVAKNGNTNVLEQIERLWRDTMFLRMKVMFGWNPIASGGF